MLVKLMYQRVVGKPCSRTRCDIEVEEVVILAASRVSRANKKHMSIVSIYLSPLNTYFLFIVVLHHVDRVLSLVSPAK
jgi:hypothetical protein